MGNTQFAQAVHILMMLSVADSRCLSSESIARSANANAVTIRRSLARFRRAGFVHSRSGTGGGTELAIDPADITLANVWRVVHGDDPVFDTYEGSAACPVGSRVSTLITAVNARVVTALEHELALITIADLVAQLPANLSVPAPA